MNDVLMALILSFAVELGVPPYLPVAIIEVESQGLATAIGPRNENGSRDWGLMQINDMSYPLAPTMSPEENIRTGITHLANLRSCGLTWYECVVAYNCGIGRLKDGAIPPRSISYAVKVFAAWERLDKRFYLYVGR
jgi:soluble lytic murein transglycosylase-like protein